MNPALVAAAVLGTLAAARLARAAILHRNHRDVGGFFGYSVLAVGVVVLVASFLALPGMWLRLYRDVISLYSGN